MRIPVWRTRAALSALAVGLLGPLVCTAMFSLNSTAQAAEASKANADLAAAIRTGTLADVKAAVAAGADLNALDDKKMPPLGIAALLGKADMVGFLAAQGADVNKNDGFGYTPLMCAAIRGQPEAAKALLEHGADPSRKGDSGKDALACAQPNGVADRLREGKEAVAKVIQQAIDHPETFKLAQKNPPAAATPPIQIAAAQAPGVPAAPANAAPAEALPKTAVPVRPLERSEIVTKGPGGALVVGQKNGKGVDGVRLSQHDTEIGSPSIALTSDGKIHVAFVEKHRTTYAYAAYHRSSSDGGKTWTEAKNLTEDMPGVGVGRCQIVADSRDRIYVIWRAGLGVNFAADLNPHSGRRHCNLWYRVLEGGKWSKARLLHPPGSPEQQQIGSMSYFATVDAAGRAQVVWNATPDKSHPEVIGPYGGRPFNGIGDGQVFQSTLDGTTATPPRDIFLPVVGGIQEKNAYCDGLDTLNGYVDAAGIAHFVALVTSTHDPVRGKSRYALIENGKAGEIIDLPELSFHEWMDASTLLVDAKGQRHVIALFRAGERPNVRDYLLGSDEEPTVIRAAAPVKGTIDGFQACQGPGGRMVVIVQANDTGELGDADSLVTISEGGGKWSAPINVTNNAGRRKFASTQTSSQSNVAVETNFVPGVATAAFDRDGRLLLVMVNSERSLVASTAFGVNIAGGSTSTPTLRFLKF